MFDIDIDIDIDIIDIDIDIGTIVCADICRNKTRPGTSTVSLLPPLSKKIGRRIRSSGTPTR